MRPGPAVPFALRGLAVVFRRLPLAGGLTKLAFNPTVNRMARRVPGLLPAVTRSRVPIEADANDYHGRILYLFGTNDPKVEHTVTTLLRPGDVFLDIGANYSSIGLAASRVVGDSGEVHLFEPQADLADRVEAGVHAAGLRTVRMHRVGLLDVDAELPLLQRAGHSGMATFVERDTTASWTGRTLPVREVGGYLGPLIRDRPFGVKIDIEGAEPKVMPWIVAQPNLRFIVFEAAHHQDDLWRIVRDAGLSVFGLCRRAVGFRVACCASPQDVRRFHDLVAVRLADAAPHPGTMRTGRLVSLLRVDAMTPPERPVQERAAAAGRF